MIEIIGKTNIDFMGKKYIAFTISGILVILGIIAVIQIANGTANLGIDFAGGTAVQVKFDQSVALDEVRDALNAKGIIDFELQDMPTVNKVLIKVKKEEAELGGIANSIIEGLRSHFTDTAIVVDSVTGIGPKVGKKLRKDALWAIIAATIGILIYVAWRFRFRFSVGATAATFHDVLAVLGLFNIMGREINLIVVSALLTIAGYSLTDTVVVFDRIRENLRMVVRDSVETVINRSINEMLSRTFITSITTLLAAGALFFLGGEVIHEFALAMMLGIAIGTYSSIFVASPIVILWGGKKPLSFKK